MIYMIYTINMIYMIYMMYMIYMTYMVYIIDMVYIIYITYMICIISIAMCPRCSRMPQRFHHQATGAHATGRHATGTPQRRQQGWRQRRDRCPNPHARRRTKLTRVVLVDAERLVPRVLPVIVQAEFDCIAEEGPCRLPHV